MGNQNRERLGLLQVFVPGLFRSPGTVLYVGAYNRRFFASAPLWKVGNKLTVLEVWEPFVEGLRRSRFSGRCAHIIHGDVRDIGDLDLPHDEYDYTLWFHGPEHVAPNDLWPTLKILEERTVKTIVLTCPWGKFDHGVAFKNPHTEHKGHYYPVDFVRRKYRVACIGPSDTKGSQLQAWKHLTRG